MKKTLILLTLVLTALGFRLSINAHSYEVSPNVYTGSVNVDNEYKLSFDIATFTGITGRQVIENMFGFLADPTEIAVAIYDVPLSSFYISTTNDYQTYPNVDTLVIKVYTSAPLYLLNVDINLFDDTGLKIVTKSYTSGLPQGFQLLAQSYGPNEPQGSYQGGYEAGYQKAQEDLYQSVYDEGYIAGVADSSDNFDYLLLLITIPTKIMGDIFSLEILPNFYAGYIAGVVIIFGLMAFFFALKKGMKK